MSVLASFLLAFIEVFNLVINLYLLIVTAAVILSWVRPDPSNPIVNLINSVTFPLFHFIRRYLPKALLQSQIDLTPMIVILSLIFIRSFVVRVFSSWIIHLQITS